MKHRINNLSRAGIEDFKDVKQTLEELRKSIEANFRPDTALEGFSGGPAKSSGHCAVVALIVQQVIGGELVSTFVHGISHWFNPVSIGPHACEIDLTGDQFGNPPVLIKEGKLYGATQIRRLTDINVETLNRAKLLASRTGLQEIVFSINRMLDERR